MKPFWDFVEKSTSNNSVNSGEIQMDNPDPSVMNDIKVIMKEQRLMGEKSIDNPNTSAEQPFIWERDENGKPIATCRIVWLDFSKKVDDIV